MNCALGYSKYTDFMVHIALWLSPICTCSEIGNSSIFRTLTCMLARGVYPRPLTGVAYRYVQVVPGKTIVPGFLSCTRRNAWIGPRRTGPGRYIHRCVKFQGYLLSRRRKNVCLSSCSKKQFLSRCHNQYHFHGIDEDETNKNSKE